MATAKKKAPAKQAAPAKVSKETSARTREKAEAYRKTGAIYVQSGTVGKQAKMNSNWLPNDLGGRLGKTTKEYKFGDKYGNYSGMENVPGRTGQRAIYQKKRAEKKAAPKMASAAKVAKGKK
jgi:hypothetical protein